MTLMIHQPDFFPWMGFFHKFTRVDKFVLLDHVTNHPKSRNWLRRVKIIVNGEEHWLSLPLKKSEGDSFVPIWQLEINRDDKQFKKLFQTIELSYKRAAFFDECLPLLKKYFSSAEPSLMKSNLQFIEDIAAALNIALPPITRSSELGITFSKTQMLAEICKKAGANSFLHTGGVGDYFEEGIFREEKIGLVPHDFKHPMYSQFNAKQFIPGLSVIDAIMNCGFKETRRLILS